VFEGKMIKHSAEIMIHACAFMTYWAGLFNAELQGGLIEGSKIMLAFAHRMVLLQAGRSNARWMMMAPESLREDDPEP
jgi:spore maturation protein SpmA